MRHRSDLFWKPASIAAGAVLCAALAHAQVDYTFYIGEHTNFSTCGGSNLNAITPQLANYLRNYGWGGTHFMEGASFPQDYMEETINSEGIDLYWGDANNLSVYAGHGYTDPRFGLSFGTPFNGRCSVDIDAEMRLGERDPYLYGGNGRASYFMALTSCTVYAPKAAEVWVNSLATIGITQVLGFHDSPSINDDEPRLFVSNVRASSGRNNRSEWLDQMDNCGPWYWGCSNSPMVLSLGESDTQVQDIHYTANLWYRYNDTPIYFPYWYMWTYRDNGAGPCY